MKFGIAFQFFAIYWVKLSCEQKPKRIPVLVTAQIFKFGWIKFWQTKIMKMFVRSKTKRVQRTSFLG